MSTSSSNRSNGTREVFISSEEGGFAYNNSNGKVHAIGDSHLAGVLQGGGGILLTLGKGWTLRGEYRYQHISDPFNHDDGINAHTFILGVLF